ncbi:hypothetical protein LCGC14_0371430 [marine sediment metagenome]|uniref:Uncharacterized protein n=1 Tax=marine sediment metagenome TaxID=412755 RepID=A0A0F9VS64_9ZZZZ|nr:hypothetical protein [bacterium]
MTLTELDNLKKNNPKRYYRFVFFIQEKFKRESVALEKIKDQASGNSGSKDVFVMNERDDFVSEIGEMK